MLLLSTQNWQKSENGGELKSSKLIIDPSLMVDGQVSPSTATHHMLSSSSNASPPSTTGSNSGSSDYNDNLRKRKVHKCDFSGCEKVYTKSSHLKAHKR